MKAPISQAFYSPQVNGFESCIQARHSTNRTNASQWTRESCQAVTQHFYINPINNPIIVPIYGNPPNGVIPRQRSSWALATPWQLSTSKGHKGLMPFANNPSKDMLIDESPMFGYPKVSIGPFQRGDYSLNG